MDYMIDLEQLDYRDRLIKNYIDEQSGGGGGSGVPLRLVLTRQRGEISPSGEDEQHLYLGVPSGMDVSDINLVYTRTCTVNQRNKRQHIESHWNKWRGLHQVWMIPVKSKLPLIVIDFKDRTHVDFTKLGYDYYEIGGRWNGVYYDMLDYINGGFNDSYQDVEQIMHHKRGGIIAIKGTGLDMRIISGQVCFHTDYCKDLDQWRLALG